MRERLPSDPPNPGLILIDLEGELFFGAAPELERDLDAVLKRATAEDAHYIVLRLKRVRNPDMVCLERFEHFLREAKTHGVTVLLAGVQADLLAAIERLHFLDWFPAGNIFVEEDDYDSATLKAVRRVYKLRAEETAAASREDAAAGEKLYYLV